MKKTKTEKAPKPDMTLKIAGNLIQKRLDAYYELYLRPIQLKDIVSYCSQFSRKLGMQKEEFFDKLQEQGFITLIPSIGSSLWMFSSNWKLSQEEMVNMLYDIEGDAIRQKKMEKEMDREERRSRGR